MPQSQPVRVGGHGAGRFNGGRTSASSEQIPCGEVRIQQAHNGGELLRPSRCLRLWLFSATTAAATTVAAATAFTAAVSSLLVVLAVCGVAEQRQSQNNDEPRLVASQASRCRWATATATAVSICWQRYVDLTPSCPFPRPFSLQAPPCPGGFVFVARACLTTRVHIHPPLQGRLGVRYHTLPQRRRLLLWDNSFLR